MFCCPCLHWLRFTFSSCTCAACWLEFNCMLTRIWLHLRCSCTARTCWLTCNCVSATCWLTCLHIYHKIAGIRLYIHCLMAAPNMQPCHLKQALACRRASLQSVRTCTACRPLFYISSTQTVSWYRPGTSCHHSPISHRVQPVRCKQQVNASLSHPVSLLSVQSNVIGTINNNKQ